MLSWAPFRRLVQEVTEILLEKGLPKDLRFQPTAIGALRNAAEAMVTTNFEVLHHHHNNGSSASQEGSRSTAKTATTVATTAAAGQTASPRVTRGQEDTDFLFRWKRSVDAHVVDKDDPFIALVHENAPAPDNGPSSGNKKRRSLPWLKDNHVEEDSEYREDDEEEDNDYREDKKSVRGWGENDTTNKLSVLASTVAAVLEIDASATELLWQLL
ncbi:hypothetical protein OPT61_g2817 [Boeremia exigua]|uniref:Uncharacterized protein n=1 Tax=Boeremia exigua TaxID=749465 RepID=A0ACC2IK32_9PLEO|nr:hypothetical protein OPT61_g2817 [Boeremia exigua]